MKLVVLDLVSNNYNDIDEFLDLFNDSEVLALSPSSFYYLENNNIKYSKFHDLISTKEFRNTVLEITNDILFKNDNKCFHGFFREVSQVSNQLFVIENIIKYIKNNNFSSVVYITDKNKNETLTPLSNNNSLLNLFIEFDKVIKIKRNIHVKKNTIIDLFKRYSLHTLSKKIMGRLSKNNLNYDWLFINPNVSKKKLRISSDLFSFDISHKLFKYVDYKKLDFYFNKNTLFSPNFLTFLEYNNYLAAYELLQKGEKLYFFQVDSTSFC